MLPAQSRSRSLRVAVADLLPPRHVGLDALSQLAERLRALEHEGRANREEAHQLLLESCFAALPSLQRLVRSHADGLSEEVAEEVVAELSTRLDALYANWTGTGSFRAYLTRILVREAWSTSTRERAHRVQEPQEDTFAEEGEQEAPLSSIQMQALRRFAWYLYGSPDNPDRVRSDKALVDFMAYCARLEGRPFADLVRDLQPRPGSWDQGRGELDCKWWRGRAQMAQARIRKALQQPRYRTAYERIVAELVEAEESTAPGERRPMVAVTGRHSWSR